MNIFLIGFMGSGKSYWAHKIAKELNMPAFDLDNIIEDVECTSIYDVFFAKGEDYFRKIENQVLQNLINEDGKYIIACGGGTPCFYNNMELMNKNGITIYLKASPTYLYDRLESQRNTRPLIAMYNNKELEHFIEKTLNERYAFYSQATSIIDIETTSLPIFVQTITECINQH